MYDGRREWSKAAALALARVAFDEGREVAVIHYSRSNVVRPLRKGDGAGLLAMVRSFLGGGASGSIWRRKTQPIKSKRSRSGASAEPTLSS